METKLIITGYAIVIADRSWVFVGNVEIDDKYCKITNAKNIRRWGTTKGLGEIAINGPTDNTVLDDYGTVTLPITSIVGGIIDCEVKKWE